MSHIHTWSNIFCIGITSFNVMMRGPSEESDCDGGGVGGGGAVCDLLHSMFICVCLRICGLVLELMALPVLRRASLACESLAALITVRMVDMRE